MVAGGGKFRGPGASVSLHRSLIAVPTSQDVHVYDLSTRTLAMVLRGHLDTVSTAKFSGLDDSEVPRQIDSVVTHTRHVTWASTELDAYLLLQARDPHDLCRQLITASADGTLGVWDVESGELRQSVLVGQPISGLAVPKGADTVHLAVRWGERDAGRVSVLVIRPTLAWFGSRFLTSCRSVLQVRFLDLATVKLLQPSIRLTAPAALMVSVHCDAVRCHAMR